MDRLNMIQPMVKYFEGCADIQNFRHVLFADHNLGKWGEFLNNAIVFIRGEPGTGKTTFTNLLKKSKKFRVESGSHPYFRNLPGIVIHVNNFKVFVIEITTNQIYIDYSEPQIRDRFRFVIYEDTIIPVCNGTVEKTVTLHDSPETVRFIRQNTGTILSLDSNNSIHFISVDNFSKRVEPSSDQVDDFLDFCMCIYTS
jgi:hypothetical protein